MDKDESRLERTLAAHVRQSHESLTFITTYKCTAACEDCCFECTPHLESEMLTFDFMKQAIDSAIDALPSLRLVVFSGGECYMLKNELYKTIAYATSKGLATRTVSNGYWGKSLDKARRIARQVHEAGITEVNFSTGLDHQQWVPLASIANGVTTLTELGVTTLVTIEKDTDESNCWNQAHAHPQIRAALAAQPSRLTVICNAWMPFKQDSKPRAEDANSAGAGEGCKQIFSNLVITPHKVVSACCGLTFEHIPEMRLGLYERAPLRDYVDDLASDFLKLWIHVDGPAAIARRLLGEGNTPAIDASVHICQACAILHQDATLRVALAERYMEFMPDVIQRYMLGKMLGTIATAREQEVAET